MAYEGINVLTGIIPLPDNCWGRHRNYQVLNKIFAVDHYHVSKGDPANSKRKYHPPVIPKCGSLIGVDEYKDISYRGIEAQNRVHQPGNYEIIHNIEIRDYSVYIDDILIASAPTGKKYSNTRKTKFCKSVIWALMNDDITLTDKLLEIGILKPVIEPDICIENITLSPYPGPGVIEELLFNDSFNYEVETDNLDSLLKEELSDMGETVYDMLSLEPDNNPENSMEIIKAFSEPKFRFYPHLKVSIAEVTA